MKDLPVVVWAAIVGPAGMPKDIVDRLNKEFNAAMARADVQAQIEQIGFTLTPSKPEALGAMIKDQAAAYRALARAVGMPQE